MAMFTAQKFYGRSAVPRMTQASVTRVLGAINNDDSEIEDLSDGDDGDEDYEPGIDSSSEDVTPPVSDDEDSAPTRLRWKHRGNFEPHIIPFQSIDDGISRDNWDVMKYIEQYIDPDLLKMMSTCTNASSIAANGNSINTSATKLYRFLGASIFMSCVGYPQVKMFWSKSLKIPVVSSTMTRDRFFKLRNKLKVVIDNDISEEAKQHDRFWKVRPLVERIRQGCLRQQRPEHVSIDEQMVPFTGACPFKQYVPNKPNPVGLKKFEIYQGADVFKSTGQIQTTIGLGGLVIDHLSRSLLPGTRIYCDRFFTGLNLIEHMLTKNMYITGTVMKNRIAEPLHKLMDDKTLQRLPRGTSDSVIRNDNKVAVIKWYDNKPILMASSIHSKDPEDTCRRWSKKIKAYVVINRPCIIREYNTNMGGVDLADRMLSYYRMSIRTKKWTIRTVMHFLDVALVNAWIEYRQDLKARETARKDILGYLEFRIYVAEAFMVKSADNETNDLHYDSNTDSDSDAAVRPPALKRRQVVTVPNRAVRTSQAKHMPEMMSLKFAMRCRVQDCKGKSRVRCKTCNVYLCLVSERKCFEAFHAKQ